MKFDNLIFRVADESDSIEIVSLANKSYRGEASLAGWTSEANLLGGMRVNEEMISKILNKKNSKILLCVSETKIIAMIHAEKVDNAAHFGLFAVEPNLQGKGIGRALLNYSEAFAVKNFEVKLGIMEVIEVRKELIDFYLRCGYKLTNRFVPFPKSEIWYKKVDTNFRLVEIEKYLTD